MRALVLIVFSLALLSGCTHEATMKSVDGNAIGQAKLEFGPDDTGMITAKIGDKLYQGRFSERKFDESRRIAAAYGFNSRRYRDYISGSGNYLWIGNATLISEDGSGMQCEFRYRGTQGAGNCQSKIDTFEFIVTDES